MKPDLDAIRTAACGRWPEIHAALGIPAQYLNTRKHQPCPDCGGRDRYRYTDHQGNGGFICNHCHPNGGSGFDLIMLVYGCDFATAARDVAAVLGMAETPLHKLPPLPVRNTPAKPPERDRLHELQTVWKNARALDGTDPASVYLQGRGLPAAYPPAIRYAEIPLYAPGNGGSLLIGYFPAMLAAVTLPGGGLQGLHRTYLQAAYSKPYGENGHHIPQYHKLQHRHPQTGEPLPAKKMQARFSGSLKGAAVHLGEPDKQGRLLVSEGIETALAASAMFGLPAAAALSANGMAAFQWPPECTALYIAADGDGVGIKAAHDLAVRAVKAGIKAEIWAAPEGKDALDVWNE